jgi:hypothetical protein
VRKSQTQKQGSKQIRTEIDKIESKENSQVILLPITCMNWEQGHIVFKATTSDH